MSTTRIIAATTVLLGVAAVLAIPSHWKPRLKSSTTTNARTVTLLSDDVSAEIVDVDDAVLIESDGLRTRVGESVLSVNERPVGTVPATTRDVEVTVWKGNVSFAADGAEVPLRD